MKKILFAMSAAAVMFAGCKKTEITTSEAGLGSVSFSISSDNSEYVTKAELPQVDVNTFKVKITGKDNGYSEEWASVSEMPGVLELVSGNYTVTATSPDAKPVAWDQPVYGGSQDFTVMVGKVSNVNLKCSITNMMVTINPTDDFLNELTGWNVTVTSEDGHLTWNRTEYDEGKAAFFDVAPLNVLVKGERFDGTAVIQQTLIIDEVAAKDHHIINLDAKVTGSIEEGGLHLTVDNTVNDKNENINIPGLEEIPVEDEPGTEEPGGETGDEEDPQPSTAPVMTWEANPDFAVTPITDPMSDVTIKIDAPEGIKEFIVKVESPTMAFLSIVSGMVSAENAHVAEGYVILDLINDATAVAALGELLPAGDAVNGQTTVNFSLSQLVPLINGFNPESGSIHTFTLSVTDQKDQTLSKSVSFKTE